MASNISLELWQQARADYKKALSQARAQYTRDKKAGISTGSMYYKLDDVITKAQNIKLNEVNFRQLTKITETLNSERSQKRLAGRYGSPIKKSTYNEIVKYDRAIDNFYKRKREKFDNLTHFGISEKSHDTTVKEQREVGGTNEFKKRNVSYIRSQYDAERLLARRKREYAKRNENSEKNLRKLKRNVEKVMKASGRSLQAKLIGNMSLKSFDKLRITTDLVELIFMKCGNDAETQDYNDTVEDIFFDGIYGFLKREEKEMKNQDVAAFLKSGASGVIKYRQSELEKMRTENKTLNAELKKLEKLKLLTEYE